MATSNTPNNTPRYLIILSIVATVLLSMVMFFYFASVLRTTPIVAATPPIIVVTATPLPFTAVPTIPPTAISRRCPEVNPFWDDINDGCLLTANSNFASGFSTTTLNGRDYPTPRRGWFVDPTSRDLAVTCTGACPNFDIAFTRPSARAGYGFALRGLENGVCYLAKTTWSYRLRGTGSDWPPNNLYAYFRVGDHSERLYEITRGASNPNPADANFISGVAEAIYPLLGTPSTTATVFMGLQVQWGVFAAGSSVRLMSAQVVEAPFAYCRDANNAPAGLPLY